MPYPISNASIPSSVDNALRFHTDALKAHAYRQQLLASNIANADTPNYKARDIDFVETLKRAQGSAQSRLATTDERHMQAGGNSVLNAKLLYRNAAQSSIDGNSVDMDVERAQFAENALRYETVLRVLNGQIRTLQSAIQGQ
ncbi:MAG: flagellar basal body rod protein FlgB [Burkholderiales bacterium]